MSRWASSPLSMSNPPAAGSPLLSGVQDVHDEKDGNHPQNQGKEEWPVGVEQHLGGASLPFDVDQVEVAEHAVQQDGDGEHHQMVVRQNTAIAGKNITLIDDSIVRGTTSNILVRLLREAGVKEVHLRLSSPEIKYPCFFGIDTSEKKTLIASTQTVEDIRRFLKVDSLTYITIEGLSKAVGRPLDSLCYACFNGDYPVPVIEEGEEAKMLLEDYRVNEM